MRVLWGLLLLLLALHRIPHLLRRRLLVHLGVQKREEIRGRGKGVLPLLVVQLLLQLLVPLMLLHGVLLVHEMPLLLVHIVLAVHVVGMVVLCARMVVHEGAAAVPAVGVQRHEILCRLCQGLPTFWVGFNMLRL